VVGRAAGLVGHIIEEKQNSLAEPLIRYADREFSVGD
jgi:citrate synthase